MQTKRKPLTTDEVIENLIGLQDEILAEPVGDHLTDEEFISYAMGHASEEETQRMDIHLCSCWGCVVEAERLSQAYKELKSPKWDERFRNMWKNLMLARAFSRAGEDFARQRLLVAHDKEGYHIWDWHDGILDISIIQDANGNWVFWFSSKDLSLQDKCFYLKLVSVEREVTLKRVSNDEVGAEVIIPSYERPPNITKISFDIENKNLSIQNKQPPDQKGK